MKFLLRSGLPAVTSAPLLLSGLGARHLVDDALDDDDLDVDVPGHVGQELGYVVVDGGSRQGDAIARCAGWEVGALAGYVEIADRPVDGEAAQVGIVDHAFAVVTLRPKYLRGSVEDPPLDAGVRHAMVVRILVH